MSLRLSKKGDDDLLENGLPLLAVVVVSIFVFITVTGIAAVGTAETLDFSDVALEQHFQRLLAVCFAASDGGTPAIGVIDESKITEDAVDKCLQHKDLGISVSLNGRKVLEEEYYKFYNLGCSVKKKPYSCGEKRLRLLLSTGEKADIVIKGVLHHG